MNLQKINVAFGSGLVRHSKTDRADEIKRIDILSTNYDNGPGNFIKIDNKSYINTGATQDGKTLCLETKFKGDWVDSALVENAETLGCRLEVNI